MSANVDDSSGEALHKKTSSSSSHLDEIKKGSLNRHGLKSITANRENVTPKPQPQNQPPPQTIRSLDDKWILIQKNTFKNWINEQLKNENEQINDLRLDLVDGTKLVKLINALQAPNSKIIKKYFKKPLNQHQSLENITLALNAITDDGIKLVNIGKSKFHSP